ncbi:helix-turn-helix transcriptional regulator [Lysinibacillus sp. RS5]|uniref:helix-turn-helix transcriptional regulator n=1 Tax=unclassified Lysinibacillus TaxID=2636778 RepID=UPI0035BE786E
MVIILKSKTDFDQKIIKLGFSKRGFARSIGVSEATMIQISNGKQSPRPGTAKKICEALKEDFDIIFEISNDRNEERGD